MPYLAPDEIFVMLENSLDPEGVSWLYRNPTRIIECWNPDQLDSSLAELQVAVSNGAYAAGLLSYEAGYVLEPRLKAHLPKTIDQPLMWFGLFDRRDKLTRTQLDNFWQEQCRGRQGSMGPLADQLTQSSYLENVQTVQDYLAAGDIYQVNYTFPMTARVDGDPAVVHVQLRQAQPVGWGAYIQTADMTISSHSPELFFEKKRDSLRLRPMKGTAPRGRWVTEDEAHHRQLVEDAKSQAENLMIVDLLRNDLGKVCAIGSVEVPEMFRVEHFARVHHLVSTVWGRLAEGESATSLLRACFPGGSVTGAPKLRAMEVIEELETQRRGLYCGAIGYLGFDGSMDTNIAIRTLVHADGMVRCWAGGGIVEASDPDREVAETDLKAKVFLDAVDFIQESERE